MTVRVRFAPSPTGNLHLGNVKTALVNYLFARRKQGMFMLRIDDTDLERSKKEYEDSIQKDLKWLGIEWDEFERQSERNDRYSEVFEQLKKDGRLYACYETGEELSLKRKALLSRGKPPIYDREGFSLTEEQKNKYESEGRKPHWRFKIDDSEIKWNDLIRGDIQFEGKNLSDPVVIRADGVPLYTLVSVIDDTDFKISHVIRGEDHIANTAIQVQMFESINAPVPTFAHMARLTDATGDKLSKRTGSTSMGDLREQGIEPMAINSILARLGSSESVEPILNIKNLFENFKIESFGRAAAKFDERDLEIINAKILHETPYENVKASLPNGMNQNSWNIIKANITYLKDVAEWWAICEEKVSPVIENSDFTQKAAELLPSEIDETTWKTWVNTVKLETGRKGKNLFMPLRLALTGQKHGPELKALLPLIGYEKAIARLNGNVA